MPDNTHSPGGVFLSYAREDTDAARRIAEAMRAFGVDAWFDQSELRGGDAWDAKIKKQIRECALFMPIISATTQARGEGYFRREWKLAVERTHDMAASRTFVVPVVIDDTPEAGAEAPEEFMRVQWTRLEHGAPTPEFIAQVKRLLDTPRKPSLKPDLPRPPTLPPEFRQAARDKAAGSGPALQKKPVSLAAVWISLGVVAVGVGVVFVVTGRRERSASVPQVEAVKPAGKSEVRQLVDKARALQEDFAQDDTQRDNLTLAEQLCKRAVELDPADAEAWAVYARVAFGLSNFDPTDARLEQGRSYARRAEQLAPDLPEVKLTMADSFRKQGRTGWPESERILRELVQSNPADNRALRMMGMVLNVQGRLEEALVYFDRAAAVPGGDAKALQSRATNLFRRQQYAEAEAAINESLALRPTASGRVAKLWFVMQRGDLPGARKLLDSLPPSSLTEQRAAAIASMLCLWLKEPETCLAILRAAPLDFFDDPWVGGMPKALYLGWAHQMAGRPEAAQTEWTNALRIVDRHLADTPNELNLLLYRAQLLGLTGQVAESARVLKVFEQLSVGSGSEATRQLSAATILISANRRDEALERLEELVRVRKDRRAWLRPGSIVGLRHSPEWESVRSDPRFLAALKDLEAIK